MHHQLDVMATLPLKGRDSHAEPMKKRPKTAMEIETPKLPFDTQPIKIRRTVLPPRPSTALNGQPMSERISKLDGSYSKKLTDSTWASSEVTARDKSPTREDIKSLDFKFEKNIEMVSGYKGVELAQRLQAVNDMLLDELVNQFRVLNLGQGKLLEKSRSVYAQVFQILDDDADKSSKIIEHLKNVAEKAEEDKVKAIEECKIRIAHVEQECQNKIKAAEDKLEAKMNEFDENMKQFLDQKAQLESHVKALHHVFLDFQSDAVYLTLEELKNQLQTANTRADKKEESNQQLQLAIAKWKIQFQDLMESKKQVEGICDDLRQQLQAANNKTLQMQRQIEILKADLEAAQEANDVVSSSSSTDDIMKYNPPTMNQQPDAVQSSVAKSLSEAIFSKKSLENSPVRKTKKRKSAKGSALFVNVHQKLCKVGNILGQFIERSTGKPVMISDQNIDEDEMQLLQKDIGRTERIIESKVDKVIAIADILNQIDGSQAKREISIGNSKPRFLSFFSYGISGRVPSSENFESTNIFSEVRKIFQAKYLHDKWNHRANKPLMRLPEFVVFFFYKDDKKIGSALHACKKLWTDIQDHPNAEIKIFKDFLLEKLSLDELTFFLEMRFGLLGLPVIHNLEPEIIKVSFEICSDLMNRVLGAFSPVASLVGDEAKALVEDGSIDYAVFLQLFIKFYSEEREKRRSAVKLMLQSRKYSDDADTPIVLEIFVSILQSLGYNGSFEDMMEFYREARIISGGDITMDGLLFTMDEMNIHFYSIDIPLDNDQSFERSEASRKMVMTHWAKFSQWFEGLRRTAVTLDTWARSQLIHYVRQVDQAFQMNYPASTLYGELRNLLDMFQFILSLIARGSPIPMKTEKSSEQLELLEDVNELLLKFIIHAGAKQLSQKKS
ncbi:hypothetical protein TRFO_39454 [Tritrichomonas foetus]|uniref:Uncharacterized protein n=1 Tax=Tritrichomonas foetus TaxID=1144522 RepID=A0A1J4J4X8_9EUKA|nr:hypothetical protein TRFO_39454 [Tritrichomonas foetus]|eukprot:OHS94370.1 hypothetical protein TRFO_39454 [Tritrichomonas foetus]